MKQASLMKVFLCFSRNHMNHGCLLCKCVVPAPQKPEFDDRPPPPDDRRFASGGSWCFGRDLPQGGLGGPRNEWFAVTLKVVSSNEVFEPFWSIPFSGIHHDLSNYRSVTIPFLILLAFGCFLKQGFGHFPLSASTPKSTGH